MANSLKALYTGFRTFKRANRGLYGSSMIKFGDTVSEMGNRFRRSFKPNIQYISPFSELLGRRVRLRASVEVIQKIDEAGGLDGYIMGQSFPESWFAEKLKYNMLMAKHKAELAQADLASPATTCNPA